MSDLLRRDLGMQPRPPRRRGERHRTRLWWLAIAKRQSRATQSRRMNTRLGRLGVGVQREPRAFMQRSVVKVSYARNARSASWAAHGHYLAREGAQREDAKGLGFDSTRDDINLSQLLAGWQKAGDPRLFRIIVSPENGATMDLKQHARELVAQMERDLGTRLEWSAIDHHNTDNPHVHILIRGVTESGNALSIDRGYIRAGIRDRSQEIASRKLGLRIERDILESRRQAVTRDQFTEIDRALLGRAGARNIVTFNDGRQRNDAARERQAQNVARLGFLESMGLARQLNQLSWQISPDLEQTLRQHQLSIDIIKTRAPHLDQIHDRQAPLHITELKPGEQVTGRVIGTGLENETTDRRYLMIECNDSKLHYIRQTPAIEKARGEDRLRVGETVTVSGREFEKNGRKVTYVHVAEHGKGRTR
jgi:type IV secretory pathway VirD2 relaxase